VHVSSGHLVADLDAHQGRRIWGLAHSPRQPLLVASVSDDRTARIWRGPALHKHAITIRPPTAAALCGVDFSAARDHLLALASSDASVYLYDLRQASRPLAALRGHRRPVSYVKFFGASGLVSASIDASLAWWDLAGLLGQQQEPGEQEQQQEQERQQRQASGQPVLLGQRQGGQPQSGDGQQSGDLRRAGDGCGDGDDQCAPGPAPSAGAGWPVHAQPLKRFSGHRNERNFVGLAVRAEDGLVACGSESSEVFSWHTSWRQPLARWQLPQAAAGGKPHGTGQGGPFASAVAWQPAAAAAQLGWPALLAAGTSNGDVELLALSAVPGAS
jgi:hypothetical protein